MSIAPTGLHDCPDIQAELDSFFQTCDASLLPDPAPFNDFLWSAQNRGNIQQVLNPGTTTSNKIRTGVLRYDQRILESEVTEPGNDEKSCTATTKRGDLTASYSIDPTDKLKVEELINPKDWRAACRGNFDIVNKKMLLLLNALRAKVATRMTERALGHIGAWPSVSATGSNISTDGGVATLKLATLKTGSSDINPKAVEELDFAIQAANFCNGAAIFGGRTLYQYLRLMDKGCCSTQGLDLAALMASYGKGIVWDRRVQNEFGNADYALAVAPGALQPIYYVENNDGVDEALGVNWGANYRKQVIFDPSTGLPVDLTLSDNCGNISIIMETVVDVVGMPSDLFAPSDYMAGVNWVAKIKVVNA